MLQDGSFLNIFRMLTNVELVTGGAEQERTIILARPLAPLSL
jgi:hypothetical protein